jgi:hypothetical protein
VTIKVDGVEFTVAELVEAARAVKKMSRHDFRAWMQRSYPFPTRQRAALFAALEDLYDSIQSGEFDRAVREPGGESP